MADIMEEINVATRTHFMPVVTNQLFYESPALYRIFRIAKEGQFGLALPSFDGSSIAEPLEVGVVTEESATYTTGTAVFTNGSKTVTGTSTSWTSAMANKGYIVATGANGDGKAYAIASVTDGTTLVLETPYEGQTLGSAESYSITYYKTVTDAVGSYGKDTTWGAGSNDVLTAANFKWKMKSEKRLFDTSSLNLS